VQENGLGMREELRCLKKKNVVGEFSQGNWKGVNA